MENNNRKGLQAQMTRISYSFGKHIYKAINYYWRTTKKIDDKNFKPGFKNFILKPNS